MRGPRPNTIRRLPVALASVALALGALAGCSQPTTPPREGGAAQSRAEKARKDAEARAADAKARAEAAAARGEISLMGGRVTINRETWEPAVHKKAVAVAKAAPAVPGTPAPAPPVLVPVPAPDVAAKGPPAPRTAPRPGAPAVVRERVVSVYPYGTEAEAEDDALAQACDLIEQKLAALDPPVRHRPSVGEVRAEFVRKDSRTVRAPDADERASFAQYGISGNLAYVEYDIEVTADQVRELRAQERVSGGLRVLGMLTAVALAGFLFFRADEWTRGYLTSWLALGAVALAAGAAVAMIFI